nr:MAG TPA: hypothetical protein [Bacteriophage sp.]
MCWYPPGLISLWMTFLLFAVFITVWCLPRLIGLWGGVPGMPGTVQA